MNNKIIVIDDEESILNDYLMILSPPQEDISKRKEKQALEAELFGDSPVEEKITQDVYEIITAFQGAKGFEIIKTAKEKGEPFALAFIDIRMPPGWDGVETARQIRAIDSDIEIVIVTAYSDRKRHEIVSKVGTPEKLLYLKKPFDPEEIRQLALSLTRKWNLEQKAMRHRRYLERLLISVKRLKTLNILSVKEILSAILNEVLYFVDAQKGFIAKLTQDKINIEINSEKTSPAEIHVLINHISIQLSDIKTISWFDSIMIFPLRNGFGNYFILISDIQPPLPEEKLELLRLLLETSSEVLESANKQERFLKNERIATIGQIAAGIVHEINNPLTVIIGTADLYRLTMEKLWNFFDAYTKLLKSDELPPEFREDMTILNARFAPEKIRSKMSEHYLIIRKGIQQIRGLMENIRGFSRGSDQFVMGVYDVGNALEDTLMLANNALKYGITVYKNWNSPLICQCDISGLKQVFLNLILNAAQAMEGVGELRIDGEKHNNIIVLSIKDSGPGIPEDIRTRIFEPFYTTKPDGTGLGLSIIKGIIDKHNGKIWVESEPGKGTTFHIEIPVL